MSKYKITFRFMKENCRHKGQDYHSRLSWCEHYKNTGEKCNEKSCPILKRKEENE